MSRDEDERVRNSGPRSPPQAEPVARTVVRSGLCADGGVEPCGDYNDPEYFFLNWPVAA